MHEDSIQKASSVEVAERRKSSVLRPNTTRGDSFLDKPHGTKKLDDDSRPALGLTKLSSSRTPLSKGNSCQPDWAQDAEDMPAPPVPLQELGSPEDLKDMLRMGRTQEMRRVFRQFSLISFGCLSQCSWEFILLNNNQTLEAGGCALLFWSYVWSFVGSMFITASLAEMASMTPSSAGQHFWVSEFASKRWQQLLSYVTAWSTLLGWQCGNASGLFLTGSLFQSMITIYRPDNGQYMWQTVVFIFPCLILVVVVNIYGTRTIAVMQNIVMSFHILALIAIIAILGVLSPHIPVKRALFQIENTDWPSAALAVFFGQTNANYSLFYVDAPIRLSEESQDAAIAVPKATMHTQVISGVCGLAAVAMFVFCVPNVAEAIGDPTGYSLLYVLQLSVPNEVIICVILACIVLVGASNIGFAAATARITYVFARDQGLPFSHWISRVHKRRLTPINAVVLTAVVIALLSLINLGSTTAFYGVVGLAQATQAMSYILPISCVLYRRIKSPGDMPKARWSLGPIWGPINNVLAIVFSINCFISAFAPPSLPVSKSNFNVAAVLFTGAMVLMIIAYYSRKGKYVGPVARTRDTPSWNLSQLGTGQNVQFLTIPEEF